MIYTRDLWATVSVAGHLVPEPDNPTIDSEYMYVCEQGYFVKALETTWSLSLGFGDGLTINGSVEYGWNCLWPEMSQIL